MNCQRITFFLFSSLFLWSARNANAQTQTFSYTGTLQNWTVPTCASVTITAYGAQGNGDNNTGGLGAEIVGTFTLTAGTVVDVMVGGEGALDPNNGAGGGGGSFVWNSSNTTHPLIAAGGGGGGTVNDAATYGGGGSADTTATVGWGIYTAAGGLGGNGGLGGSNGAGQYSGAGGGCGWLSNGQDGTPGSQSNPAGGGGATPSNGGTGGIAAQHWGAVGGYGGGGGGGISGGGGGGYNGGGGGTAYPISPSTCGGGGGGGSYNGGANQTNTAATNRGNGSVTIAWTNIVIPVTAIGNLIANENTCNGNTGKASVITTGAALSYLWTPSGQTKDTATGLSAGTYSIAVNSACGGSASATVTITQPANVISATASVVSNVSCHGGSNGSVSASVSGVGSPYTYLWVPSNQTTALAAGLAAGIYTVEVYNACGASATAMATITQPASLGITANVTANVLCNGGNNGSAISHANSGTPPYNYNWLPSGGNLDTTLGLAAGTYSVTLTDANGCTGSTSVTITQPNVLTTSASTVTEVACNGGSTGSAMSTPNGGTNPYTYAWTGGETAATANGLSMGTYSVNIVDANGCTASASTIITQPTALNVISNTTPDSTGCTGTAWVAANGGVLPYTYAWTPGGNQTYYVHYACHDTFCYTVTDNHGCKDIGCAVIPSELGVSNITANKQSITVYPNPNSGQFTVESSIGGGQWTVEVYNMLGEKVYNQINISQTTYKINLGGQAGGIYLYRVLSSENGNLLGEGKLVIEK